MINWTQVSDLPTHSVGPTVLLVVSDFLDIFDVEILTNDVYVKVQKKFEMTFHNCILQCSAQYVQPLCADIFH